MLHRIRESDNKAMRKARERKISYDEQWQCHCGRVVSKLKQ